MKIAIDAEIYPYNQGGVTSVIIGLVSALGKLQDSNDQYVIICDPQDPDWLKPYLAENQEIVSRNLPTKDRTAERFKRLLGPLRPIAGKAWRSIFPPPDTNASSSPWSSVPVSDGFYENLKCDVFHIPFQNFILSSIPTIYNPHDLQHLHYPQFFSAAELAHRDSLFKAGCHFANTVIAGSHWVKQDLINNYSLSPNKIQIIPWAPPTEAYSDPGNDFLETVKKTYSLPPTFAFYPAFTWPHKNHIRLLEAAALVRNREGISVNLVFVGAQTSFSKTIEEKIDELKLRSQVWSLGQVSADVLRSLYAISQFVVIPTLFEAASGPMFEAWHHHVPVTSSHVTSLPEQAAGAALLFDPLSVEDIAAALFRMVREPDLRAELIERGKKRLQDFSWDRTAKAYRAVYRRAAGMTLTNEDQHLLTWNWMQTADENKKKSQSGSV